MCGIAGFGAYSIASRDNALNALQCMANAISQRGPDDEGYSLYPSHGVGLAHRRLSILDLSPTGHQPMVSSSGKLAIVFNGEIYNYLEIRSELEALGCRQWRGTSDTEVLLTAIEMFGLRAAIERCVGMFAFAVYDLHKGTISLARDRAGEKPLFYQLGPQGLLFGSDTNAIRAFPQGTMVISNEGLQSYLVHGYVAGSQSIFDGVRRVRPGEVIEFSLIGGAQICARYTYWQPDLAGTEKFDGSPAEAKARLRQLLTEAVRLQMRADVPVGAFLSGGVDSSLIVSLMAECTPRRVKTFSVGFDVPEFNEAPNAARVAAHIGTDHTEVILSAQDVLAELPALMGIWDEPLGDGSQIPTAIVARLASEAVTVSLSGDGGDELFSGYRRYRVANLLKSIPGRQVLYSALSLFDEAFVAKFGILLPKPLARRMDADRVQHVKELLRVYGGAELYQELFYRPSHNLKFLSREAVDASLNTFAPDGIRGSFLRKIALIDFFTYLPDDILVKVDRATMAYGLEARAPLLDHRLIQFAYSLPERVKHLHGQAKWPLRSLLYDRIPKRLVDRPKMGFSFPMDEWLRGPLKEWASDLLHSRAGGVNAHLDHQCIERMWAQHLSGLGNHSVDLWKILALKAWSRRLA